MSNESSGDPQNERKLTPSVLSWGPGTGQRGSIFVRFGGHQNFRLTLARRSKLLQISGPGYGRTYQHSMGSVGTDSAAGELRGRKCHGRKVPKEYRQLQRKYIPSSYGMYTLFRPPGHLRKKWFPCGRPAPSDSGTGLTRKQAPLRGLHGFPEHRVR